MVAVVQVQAAAGEEEDAEAVAGGGDGADTGDCHDDGGCAIEEGVMEMC